MLFVMTAGVAGAAPIATIEGIETSLGGGQYQYDYTVTNAGDPILDLGYDLYDFSLLFSGTLVSSVLPPDWDIIAGPGFLETFSLVPGLAPAGADIGPGQSKIFTFVFDNKAGSVAFSSLFANPLDPANPVALAGTTTVAPASPVPEPATLLLLGTGAGVWLRARRRRA